ncbi:hypothetical protein [uncultured Pseudokineococcus sp.]|uniref:cupredoxin domain-containing protein n=1 Tax=uncultured Pseudokineococcus sp. TaxID=1642928 RepID=UPI00260F0D96|nr:hypothetical protein [uncultured Pseudokineococcus sp.]
MRAPALALAALLVLATAGCGDDASEPAGAPAAAPSSAPSSASSSAPSGGSSSEGGAATADASVPVLRASVGTPDDPEAYVISLVDADGQEVTELPAGDYVVEVDDPATSHNVHLEGPGVDESTTVPETTTTQWRVSLQPGDYVYRCDPHPSMVGELTVTDV